MSQTAKRFGIEEKYTEGRTKKDWVRWGDEQTLKKTGDKIGGYRHICG